MKPITSFAFLLLCLGAFRVECSGRDYTPKLGPYSSSNKFKYDAATTNELYLHRFIPRNMKIKAYNNEGQTFDLLLTDTVRVANIYSGSWAGRKGKWIQFYDQERDRTNSTFDYYVLVKEMTDVEGGAKILDGIAQKERLQTSKQEFINDVMKLLIYIALGAGLIAILVLLLIVFRKHNRSVAASKAVPTPINGQSNKFRNAAQFQNSNSHSNTFPNLETPPYSMPKPSSTPDYTPNKPYNSGNWTPGGGNVGDTYGGSNTYGFGLPNYYGQPQKGADGNYYQGGKNLGKKPGRG